VKELHHVGISPVEYVTVGSLSPDILGKNYGARIKPDVVEFLPLVVEPLD
jgi:hypothetical protein